MDKHSQEIFKKTLSENYSGLLHFVSKKIGDKGAAEDTLQEGLLSAFQALPQFRGESSLKTWIFGILQNKIRDHYYQQGRHKAVIDASNDVDESIETSIALGTTLSAQEQFAELEKLTRLDDFLQLLPDEMQHAIYEIGVEGKSYEEVSQATGIPMGTLASRVSRARQQLKQALEE
ncbi:RNA polymerase sigma factor [Glaciimonas sp. GG7]